MASWLALCLVELVSEVQLLASYILWTVSVDFTNQQTETYIITYRDFLFKIILRIDGANHKKYDVYILLAAVNKQRYA